MCAACRKSDPPHSIACPGSILQLIVELAIRGLCDGQNSLFDWDSRGRPHSSPEPECPKASCTPLHSLAGPLCPPSLIFPPPPPPLQDGLTPLHMAAIEGHVPVVALLLASPGVNPLAKDVVRGAQRRLRALPACLSACYTPLPSAAVSWGSAGLCAGQRTCSRSRAAAGGPARCSGSRQGIIRGRRRHIWGTGSHSRSGAASLASVGIFH